MNLDFSKTLQFTFCFLLSLTVGNSVVGQAPEEDTPKTVAELTDGLQKHEGFFNFYWDESKGKVLLEVNQLDQEFLYVHSLATGLGSNPVGLDRGKLGDEKVVHFRRVGPKIFLYERNLRFRAQTDNELETRAVRQSFAESIIWGGKVEAETDGTLLIDITSLLMTDMQGVIQTLKQSDQGDFSMDENRSAIYLPRCKSFPENTEFEATLTFKGSNPGRHVRQTTPTPNSISLRQHHSFVKLPDDEYKPREYDVRSPCIFVTYADYATPLESSLQKRLITRHRLIKKDPTADVSEAVEPIIYYVDAGAPKQIQQALVEGASWWNDAFESAGFKDAFQVKLLPPDADPMDVRYNVIQWVHRSTRGWSYGGSVTDPRTGEIIKGHVTLGSLRVRQDQLLVNGLNSTPGINCACCGLGGIAEEASLADLDSKTDALDVALARIRQLSAHEVGHTIGFVHNFAASTYADRASVMDYPAPRVKIDENGQLDLSDAYGVGIGAWDKVSVQFAYSQFRPEQNEKEELGKILEAARQQQMIFISDSDARPAHAAHPLGNLWDNGTDPLEQLKHILNVRRIAMQNFDPAQLPEGTTTAEIAEYFTPLYLHHRYQLQATAKLIGGSLYEYGYTHLDSPGRQPIPAQKQFLAIQQLLETITPQQLSIPATVRDAIAPKPYQAIRDQELFASQTGRIFDPLAAARTAIDLTLDELFQPQRLARLSVQSRMDPSLAPELLINNLYRNIWDRNQLLDPATEQGQLGQLVRIAVFEKLEELVDNPSNSLSVRSGAWKAIDWHLNRIDSGVPSEMQFQKMLRRRANQILNRPIKNLPDQEKLKTPPGSPIGQ